MVATAVLKFSKNDPSEQRSDSVQNFCMRIRKGSKKFRKIISEPHISSVSNNIKKFSEIIDLTINGENSAKLNSLWTLNFLDNQTKTFTFKFHNNILGLNSRVSHFVRNHSPNCTFCDLTKNPSENRESFIHLFFECPTVEELLTGYGTWIKGGNIEIGRREFFTLAATENLTRDYIFNISNLLVKKFIWDSKQRFTIPKLNDLKLFLKSEVRTFSNISKNFQKKLETSGLANILL